MNIEPKFGRILRVHQVSEVELDFISTLNSWALVFSSIGSSLVGMFISISSMSSFINEALLTPEGRLMLGPVKWVCLPLAAISYLIAGWQMIVKYQAVSRVKKTILDRDIGTS